MTETISLIESLTIREGKLSIDPIFEEGVHPCHFKEFQKSFRGRRYFVLKNEDEWLPITISWTDIWKLGDKNKPKKIFAQIWNSNYGKQKGMRGGGSGYVDLKYIYTLNFVDEKTEKKFKVSFLDRTLDYFRPGEKVKVYWGFNPWAGNGTGWEDWKDPNYVYVLLGDNLEVENYTKDGHSDLFDSMKRAEYYIERNMKNLTNYTGINY